MSIRAALKSEGKIKVELRLLRSSFPPSYQPTNKITPLHAAIWQNNLRIVTFLVEGGAAINSDSVISEAEKKASDSSPIEVAAEYGRLAILQYLIEKGGNISNNGAFNTAASGGFYECAKLLLLKGANQEKGDERGKHWMLEQAVIKSDYDVLAALTLNDDEINSTNYNGETALIIAVKNNNAKMVKYLLERGADKKKPETFESDDDKTTYGKKPIQIAKKMKFAEIVKLLE